MCLIPLPTLIDCHFRIWNNVSLFVSLAFHLLFLSVGQGNWCICQNAVSFYRRESLSRTSQWRTTTTMIYCGGISSDVAILRFLPLFLTVFFLLLECTIIFCLVMNNWCLCLYFVWPLRHSFPDIKNIKSLSWHDSICLFHY